MHYTEVEKIQTRQINQLFKKITYKRDDVAQFHYDHQNDQNQIVGLGSYEDETLSAGRRDSDCMDDFLDSDSDELVELDTSDPDEVDSQVNQLLNLDDDDDEAFQGLVRSGKGRFQAVAEAETPVTASATSSAQAPASPQNLAGPGLRLPLPAANMAEEDEQVPQPAFLSARTLGMHLDQKPGSGAALLPFVLSGGAKGAYSAATSGVTSARESESGVGPIQTLPRALQLT